MAAIGSFWARQPDSVRLILLVLIAVLVISIPALTRVAIRLFKYPHRSIVLKDVLGCGVAPSLLAKAALANQGPTKAMLLDPTSSTSGVATSEKQQLLRNLRVANVIFLFVSDRCNADVMFVKRASTVTLLVSFVMVPAGANARCRQAVEHRTGRPTEPNRRPPRSPRPAQGTEWVPDNAEYGGSCLVSPPSMLANGA